MMNLIEFYACLCLLFCGISLSSESLNYHTDESALLAFKDKITEDPLGVLRSWNNSLHFCEWEGVKCDPKHQRVTELVLVSQQLMGSLSPHVGNLSFIKTLNIQDNKFHGVIPRELGRLPRLQYLGLSNNSFRGEIPASLSNCSNLVQLCLASNKLTGRLPVELGSLSKLYYLNLRRNEITGTIPSSFGNLSAMGEINLNYNNLEGSFPDSMGKMRSLIKIRSGSNNLSGAIPPSLWNHSSLVELYVADNQLQGSIPADIGLTLPNLENFGIAGNSFSGSIPNSISKIARLDFFYVAGNNLVGPVPADLGRSNYLEWLDLSGNHFGSGKSSDLAFLDSLINCSRLKVLRLNNNGFGGTLPNAITHHWPELHSLQLGHNRISGRLPEGLGNLLNLTELILEQNLFTGTIPSSIGKLHKLRRLNLNGNNLSGKIPTSIGELTKLYELHLQKNNLTGRIPRSFKNLQHLQRLDLSKNYLSSNIPEEVLSSFTSVIYLNLSQNSLSGPLPMEVGSSKNLRNLDISQNKLFGEIPSAIRNCLKLEQLYMGSNLFQGNLSSYFGELKALQHLDLSRNNLSGEIPKELERLSLLENLNLSFNDLQGEVPMAGVFRNVSAISITGNSKLCGGIPELQLPHCATQKRRSLSSRAKIVVSIVVLSSSFLTILLALYCRRKTSKNPSAVTQSFKEDSFPRVSYTELLMATNGFSQAHLIGMGSYGSVYRGFLHIDKSPVAIKVLNLERGGASKSFFAECEALRDVRHRNLLKLLTSCSSTDFKGNDFKALVYRFMSNGNLESWLHRSAGNLQHSKTLSFGQRLNIAIDIASALDYLHHHCQNPITHCDLKPSNVLLDDNFTAHVGDFGLARFLATAENNQTKDEASSVAVKGSIGYVPPEYGLGSKVSTHGDVYSFGIVLLEMLTGKRPTDEMFKNGFNLRDFTEWALPDKVMEIADAKMLEGEYAEDAVINIDSQLDMEGRLKECLESIFSIGVACSAESPTVRMNIKDVVVELNLVRETYLDIRMH
ncbi:hypothetical protein Scep_005614 [Stephania cephalantha]|uniref:non-specific serine/threonine protein kinase n=1 Tax=Stephania cephalantha TaxID=152367 RepID=A0AAP0PXN2_9MAGN